MNAGEYAAHCELRTLPECECLPGVVCSVCTARGYRNGLAGYAARIHPERVTDDDVAEQERADRVAELGG